MMGSKQVKLWSFACLSFFAGIFSFIDAVPILVLFYPSFILLFQMTLTLNFDKISKRRRLCYYLIGLLMISTGQTLGCYDYLTVLPTVPISMILTFVIMSINKLWINLLRFSLQCLSQQTFFRILFIILSYPSMFCAFFVLMSISPFSTLLNISNGLWRFSSIAQIASIFGIHSLTFLHFWCCALCAIYLFLDKLAINPPVFRRNFYFFIGLILCISLFGGFRLNTKWHRDPSKWTDNKMNLRALCITENTQNWQTQQMDLDLILTEEEFTNEAETKYYDLQQYAQGISLNNNHSVMLGIGLYDPNSFELWIANKTQISKIYSYLKGNPVPFVENFKRRQQKPPVIDLSQYGFHFSVSTLICFDMLYPIDWALHASKATLILNPSWLWNSFMNQFLHILSFRAIENGFNVFHCAQNGNTAQIDGFGQIVFKHVNNERVSSGRLIVSEISGQTNVWTVYANIGFLFDWICCVMGIICIVLSIFVLFKRDLAMRLEIELIENGFNAMN